MTFLKTEKICKQILNPQSLYDCLDFTNLYDICRDNVNYTCFNIKNDQCRQKIVNPAGYFGC
jgi:hypothetical protein